MILYWFSVHFISIFCSFYFDFLLISYWIPIVFCILLICYWFPIDCFILLISYWFESLLFVSVTHPHQQNVPRLLDGEWRRVWMHSERRNEHQGGEKWNGKYFRGALLYFAAEIHVHLVTYPTYKRQENVHQLKKIVKIIIV